MDLGFQNVNYLGFLTDFGNFYRESSAAQDLSRKLSFQNHMEDFFFDKVSLRTRSGFKTRGVLESSESIEGFLSDFGNFYRESSAAQDLSRKLRCTLKLDYTLMNVSSLLITKDLKGSHEELSMEEYKEVAEARAGKKTRIRRSPNRTPSKKVVPNPNQN
ncbi:hypothetical protein YC2023_084038 [Brassica napus]